MLKVNDILQIVDDGICNEAFVVADVGITWPLVVGEVGGLTNSMLIEEYKDGKTVARFRVTVEKI